MKNDDLMVLGLAGVAAFLVAKAAGLQLPSLSGLSGGAQSFAQSIWRPLAPEVGTPYNPVRPGDYIWNNDLVNGTVHDFYNNDQTSYSTPTITEIVDDVLGSTYGTGKKSIVRVDGQWW